MRYKFQSFITNLKNSFYIKFYAFGSLYDVTLMSFMELTNAITLLALRTELIAFAFIALIASPRTHL